MIKSTLFFLMGCLTFTGLVTAEHEVKLYGTPYSPFVRKVMSVLEHKHVNYELDPTLPPSVLKKMGQAVSLELEHASPLGKIPAMRVPEGMLADSFAINVYLEKKWDIHSLIPSSPYLAARSAWFEQYAGTEMSDVFTKIYVETSLKPRVFHAKTDDALVEQLKLRIPEILTYLENTLNESKTSYLVSHELTVGDIAVLHQFVGLKIANFQLDLTPYPKLREYLERGLNHPSIQKVISRIN